MPRITCGFIGLGLIGGSIARALKKNIPDIKIIAYDTSGEALALAKNAQIADVTAKAIDHSFSDCDFLMRTGSKKRRQSDGRRARHEAGVSAH